MPTRYPSATKVPHLLHGGDYNPEQWIDYPDIWNEDYRLMKLAGVNLVSIGIFSWVMLEPEEGRFTFDWLDRVMDNLAQHGIYANLATPSGAKPNWMAAKYPQIRRVDDHNHRDLQRGRHNHCYTSPVYREKISLINDKLAQRYQNHPALAMWHVSNEYSGECHCDLCKQAFRAYVKDKYKTLDALNHAWWTAFWSHRYTDWSQIEAIDPSVHGLVLDWKRFITHQTVDFMKVEVAPLKKHTPTIPVTTNMMGTYTGLDYWKFRGVCDVIGWDAYPGWHRDEKMIQTAARTAFVHDLNRSLAGGKPFFLLESTPSQTNWRDISPLKRPGIHKLSSMQAVAHGGDAVMYFQWRKSRGSSEKFHGAVVDHVGHENTRVFREVAELGDTLRKLDAVVGTGVPVETAVIFDWENRWALDAEQGPRNVNKDPEFTACHGFYQPLWKRNIPADVIDMDQDFSKYKLLIAPMLYMIKPGVAQRIAQFIEDGGTFVTTYFSGLVNETDLCTLDGFPGPLRKLMGVWAEETDVLTDTLTQSVEPVADNGLGLSGSYAARHYCDIIHAEGSKVLATYGKDFYAGTPALTVNSVGKGQAYYIASRNEERFQDDFFKGLARTLGLKRSINADVPDLVSVQRRTDGKRDYLFFLNFNAGEVVVPLEDGSHTHALSGQKVSGSIKLPGYGTAVLVK